MLAIAITLLVLEISVPEAAFDDLWKGIRDQWPSYLAYATSFLTIGGIWLFHHGVFRQLKSADAIVVRINIALLMAVSFLPFPTRLMAEAINRGQGESAAVLFYGACLLVTTATMAALARYSARAELVADPRTRARLLAMSNSVAPSLGFYAVVIVLALFAPTVAIFGFLGLALRAVSKVR